MRTVQMDGWSGQIGKEYTDRNALNMEDWELLYKNRYGLTRTELNSRFLGDLPRDIRILEVGCNVGNQLRVLQGMGFKNLYGVELQWYAVEQAKQRTQKINIIQGSAFDIPFRDGYFDLVYTSGVLIHFTDGDIGLVFDEICRCTKRYIWALEYYAPTWTEIPWRGNRNLMWKADYSRLFRERCPILQLVKEEHYPYLEDSKLVDTMFLLEKA